MVNLMTVDAQRVMTLVETLNQLWSAPLQICVAVYFLYVTMGVAVMAGVGMLLLLIPLNLLIARLVRKIQVKGIKVPLLLLLDVTGKSNNGTRSSCNPLATVTVIVHATAVFIFCK